jgi:hypothetical protein
MTTTLRLDSNERAALESALNNYLDGEGMPSGDEDEPVLVAILAQFVGQS